jgi:hypothetical protein
MPTYLFLERGSNEEWGDWPSDNKVMGADPGKLMLLIERMTMV